MHKGILRIKFSQHDELKASDNPLLREFQLLHYQQDFITAQGQFVKILMGDILGRNPFIAKQFPEGLEIIFLPDQLDLYQVH